MEGVIREAGNKDITRGTHLTAVYPALFLLFLTFQDKSSNSIKGFLRKARVRLK